MTYPIPISYSHFIINLLLLLWFLFANKKSDKWQQKTEEPEKEKDREKRYFISKRIQWKFPFANRLKIWSDLIRYKRYQITRFFGRARKISIQVGSFFVAGSTAWTRTKENVRKLIESNNSEKKKARSKTRLIFYGKKQMWMTGRPQINVPIPWNWSNALGDVRNGSEKKTLRLASINLNE